MLPLRGCQRQVSVGNILKSFREAATGLTCLPFFFASRLGFNPFWESNMQNKTISRLPKVIQKTGLSRSTIYALLSRGEFPKPIKLSPRTIGWLESDIDAWLDARIANCKGG